MQLVSNNSSVRINAANLTMRSRTNAALDTIALALQQSQRPIVTTKFGRHSSVLLHLISEVDPLTPVIWIENGYNTESTKNYAIHITEALDLTLHIYHPKATWSGEIPTIASSKHEAFVEHVKLEPFSRVLTEQKPDVWFTALRREQTDLRDQMSTFQIADQGVLKVCPLLDWREDEMDMYISMNHLDFGEEAFDPTKASPKLECGLHRRF